MPSPYNEKPKHSSADDKRPGKIAENTPDFTISLRRTGCAVQITLTATEDYSAIELFDSLVNSIEHGRGINLGAALSTNNPPGSE